MSGPILYAGGMDVAVTDLRTNLRHWLERVGAGDEVVITERGVPVARLTPVESADTIARLTREGVIAPPRTPTRPRADGAARPRVGRSLSDLVSDQRR